MSKTCRKLFILNSVWRLLFYLQPLVVDLGYAAAHLFDLLFPLCLLVNFKWARHIEDGLLIIHLEWFELDGLDYFVAECVLQISDTFVYWGQFNRFCGGILAAKCESVLLRLGCYYRSCLSAKLGSLVVVYLFERTRCVNVLAENIEWVIKYGLLLDSELCLCFFALIQQIFIGEFSVFD